VTLTNPAGCPLIELQALNVKRIKAPLLTKSVLSLGEFAMYVQLSFCSHYTNSATSARLSLPLHLPMVEDSASLSAR
jgi:hypothetical protein